MGAARPSPGHHSIDIVAYVAAVALAGAAAYFSIRGMVVLFPGAPLAIVVMAVAMESAKLVTAAWLARRWRQTAPLWRLVLVCLIAGLALINAAGVFSQLVAAHVGERGAAMAAVGMLGGASAAAGDHPVRRGVRAKLSPPSRDFCELTWTRYLIAWNLHLL